MQALQSLLDVADQFDAIVLDQWGVLHDGSAPYPSAITCVEALHTRGTRLAVLSNSGKRSGPNADRIGTMGFDAARFAPVMTSGEALYQDMAQGRLAYQNLYPITRAPGDAADWAAGLPVRLVDSPHDADAILLMGLPDDAQTDTYRAILAQAASRGIPVLCTNPDRASPRAGGAVVVSPGALAHEYASAGGDVRFYGKPHAPVFRALEAALDLAPDRILMVGDSLEHDIKGGAEAGWATALVRGGLHARAFADGADDADVIAGLAARDAAPLPTFTLAYLE